MSFTLWLNECELQVGWQKAAATDMQQLAASSEQPVFLTPSF